MNAFKYATFHITSVYLTHLKHCNIKIFNKE